MSKVCLKWQYEIYRHTRPVELVHTYQGICSKFSIHKEIYIFFSTIGTSACSRQRFEYFEYVIWIANDYVLLCSLLLVRNTSIKFALLYFVVCVCRVCRQHAMPARELNTMRFTRAHAKKNIVKSLHTQTTTDAHKRDE